MRGPRAALGFAWSLSLLAAVGVLTHTTACLFGDYRCEFGYDPPPCPDRFASQCDIGDGCTWGLRCIDSACPPLTTRDACEQVDRCHWDYDACVALNRTCADSGSTPESCSATPGCVWGSGCTGQPTGAPCSSLEKAACTARRDCVWKK